MSLLESIHQPSDLRALQRPQLDELAAEIRQFLISNVSRTGGHLGPNLGVVELTLALHLTFDSPHDPIIFDTGHQSYVHKMLTGRGGEFASLRQKDGLSGYPCVAESEHDWVENSHASTALSWAEGLAHGFQLRGETDRTVVAVIGDGALTGGMAWEALNNIAIADDLPLVIVVNDNGRSYAPTVGGLSRQLGAIRTDPRYEQTLETIKTQMRRARFGRTAYDVLHGMKSGLKDILAPQEMFSDLGLKYLGPIDGHDLDALTEALELAKGFGGPVIVHAITKKGHGFRAAELNKADHFHTVGRIDATTGEPLSAAVQATWTDAFAQQMMEIADDHPDVVALTAAMLHPVGLTRFAAAYPERTFDVGIAEQHAMTMAAGLARAGLHPVFAVYSTFLNRAFDQLLLDVGLHKLGVTVVLDRAGITGPDGASHNGIWDVSLAGIVPGLMLASPRDQPRLAEVLTQAVETSDAPTLIRYSKEKLPDPMPAVVRRDGLDVLSADEDADVLLVAWGAMCARALKVADLLRAQGITVSVVDPVWGLPISPALVEMTRHHRLIVTIEDNLIVGGLGSHLELEMDAAGIEVPTRQFGVPQRYLQPATRNEIFAEIGLTPQAIAREVTETMTAFIEAPTVDAERFRQ
ncbi:1-deoxy-D-xylulose-5-phosphate synthase [Brooklawnia propionicigenes]|uniref:1-deoxy-D-xylulose-5-phosphate synthase n=1 Tax=Brooklawnia propionicigenes TaxID=3041175 RepID=A0AAN0K5S6_9ACTN|nr:1-deoxy-D-xylulose-5-phosphate synthase [Brooklawnia sp. SH051]BEH00918.1 1-deoxy-D-xylulose-5-phosphate synthase [Brooklawnia sp. SH051]